MRRVFAISPYHTGSHAAWATGYAAHSQHDVSLLTMAGRFWKWRLQGGAFELAQQAIRACRAGGRPDALLVTDMTNLPALLALARPYLDGVPTLYYAHENQLTYPTPPGEKRDLTYAAINLSSMACAEAIAFNSAYHRDEFFAELPRFLKHFPDYNHLELIPNLQAKSQILPVGLDLQRLQIDNAVSPDSNQSGQLDGAAAKQTDRPLCILWNQRWEYDKNPAEFFAALYVLQAEHVPFELIVAGENFRQHPAEFTAAQHRLADQIVHFGYAADARDYAHLLHRADLVLSTAQHEFFGISMLEAIYCGCYPLLPHRLSYPELLPAADRDRHLYPSFAALCDRLRWAAANPQQVRATNLSAIAAAYAWPLLAPQYDRVLSDLACEPARL